ncbi:thiaminase II [Neisseria perflava]|uniref:thiaminase II n=1 Tax=Neisseria perflava TaxID=33053 RepID=UPI00209FA815|nr:thiaminase II [Neisseria perflava]MCP1659241.1 thiaminase/transcriptional activator TenA [Neisseria perflava]MCP1771717.1 thiaminase/transcriptional activator TenA [Neisseria perflava]
MTFTQDVWQRNAALFQATLNLPFNRELADGTLNQVAFCHYVIQDAHYLEVYGRAMAVCAAKAADSAQILQFLAHAREAVEVERQLHGGFMQQFGITAAQYRNTPLSAACHHYTSYLLATAWSESYPVVVAALLPCFWIYAEVGKDICTRSVAGNPYQAWIDTYSGEEFHEAVHKVLSLTDTLAAEADVATVAKMHATYTTAAKLEWQFWHSAYQQRQWGDLDNVDNPHK